MLTEILLPDASQLQLIDCHLEGHILSVKIRATQFQSYCPDCGQASARIHSRYERTLVDLPCSTWHVQLCWTVRRFFCDNPQCSRRTFAEQLPEVAVPYARRTRRLAERQTQVAFEAGGECGCRICTAWGLDASGDQLLRLIRHTACVQPSTPRVLGIDDWALRKRHSYGTILIDLERQCVVDLLPDREAATVADWLRQHPEVEIVSRDRGQNYIDGVTAGAPHATQVADRFHLLWNLHEALTKICERRSKDLKAVAQELATTGATSSGDAELTTTPSASRSPLTRRECLFQQVKQLQQQGVSQRAAARETGLHRRTIARYYRLQELPPRAATYQTRWQATVYLPYLLERWAAGHRNRRELFEEIQAQGFTGSYASVWRALCGIAQGRAAAIRCLSCCTAGRWCKVVVWRNPPTESVHIVGLVSFDGERLWVYAGAREIAETLLWALAVKVLACVEAEDSDGCTWDVFDAAPGTAEHFEALEDASPPPLRPLGLRLISVARTDIPLPAFKACAAYPDAGEESQRTAVRRGDRAGCESRSHRPSVLRSPGDACFLVLI